jgi:hypothetical protein
MAKGALPKVRLRQWTSLRLPDRRPQQKRATPWPRRRLLAIQVGEVALHMWCLGSAVNGARTSWPTASNSTQTCGSAPGSDAMRVCVAAYVTTRIWMWTEAAVGLGAQADAESVRGWPASCAFGRLLATLPQLRILRGALRA